MSGMGTKRPLDTDSGSNEESSKPKRWHQGGSMTFLESNPSVITGWKDLRSSLYWELQTERKRARASGSAEGTRNDTGGGDGGGATATTSSLAIINDKGVNSASNEMVDTTNLGAGSSQPIDEDIHDDPLDFQNQNDDNSLDVQNQNDDDPVDDQNQNDDDRLDGSMEGGGEEYDEQLNVYGSVSGDNSQDDPCSPQGNLDYETVADVVASQVQESVAQVAERLETQIQDKLSALAIQVATEVKEDVEKNATALVNEGFAEVEEKIEGKWEAVVIEVVKKVGEQVEEKVATAVTSALANLKEELKAFISEQETESAAQVDEDEIEGTAPPPVDSRAPTVGSSDENENQDAGPVRRRRFPVRGKPRCPYCKIYFANASAKCVHIQRVHEGKTWACEHCGAEYGSPSAKRTHILKTHLAGKKGKTTIGKKTKGRKTKGKKK